MMQSKTSENIEIRLVDGLSASNTYVRTIVEDGYKTAINKAAWTFEFLYLMHKIKIISRFSAFLISYFVKPDLEKLILEKKPDKIVIFHFFLIRPVFEIIEKHKLALPVITVVTDPFTAHPIWFIQEGQNFIVFSEMLRDKCIENGISPDNLAVFPFVLNNKYSQKVSERKKAIIRHNLGFKPFSKIILIIGGGEGMPKGKKILKKILARNMDAEIAIVCGKNIKLYSIATKLKIKYGLNNLKVYGFVDFVHSLLSISDIVITKCGASTSMEILIMGKVPVINNYIWEQEKGNMEFVCGKDMGVLEKNISYIPEVLNRLLTDNEYFNFLSNNIKKAAIKNGVEPVSDYILNFKL